MARYVAKVLSASDCETQTNNDHQNNEVNKDKRNKQNSKYLQESEDEIISTSKTKLKLYENSHMSQSQK